MDVHPTIRTSREEHARSPGDVSSRKWTGDYASYLLSPGWRRTRDAALRRAGWTCNRCPARKRLEVHHRTYDRLGCELPADLEVLCADCHGNHHYAEEVTGYRVVLRIVSAVLERERFECMADLTAAVKDECVRLKVAYDHEKVNRAIRTVDASRRGVVDAPKPKPILRPVGADDAPIGPNEARRIVRDVLGLKMTFRDMPVNARELSPRERDIQKALEMVATAMKDSQERCAELESQIDRSEPNPLAGMVA